MRAGEGLLRDRLLSVRIMRRGYAWLDTGTNESLLEASAFIEAVQKRQGLMIRCHEEIAFRNKWINAEDVEKAWSSFGNSDYWKYLKSLLDWS